MAIVGVGEQFGKSALLKAGFDSVDYVAIRDAETLEISLATCRAPRAFWPRPRSAARG